jgi:hypothetical protein
VSEEEYIAIVGEIFDGYTEFEYKGQPVYLKHFSIRDQRYIHKYYEKYKNIAIKKGIPTEKQMLDRLVADGLWSEDDDKKIAELELEISNLKQTKLNLVLPSQKEKTQESIDERSKDLNILKIKRKEVVGKTAEDYGSSRSNEEFIRYIIYKDSTLKEHLFTEESFAEINDYDINYLIKQHHSCSSRLNEDNIQHAVLRDFFNMYLSQTENLFSFYGKPIIQLSVYQLKLALYARIFFNIFQYNEDIPDIIKKNPSDILRFSESKRNSGKVSEKFKSSDNGATAVFGATKEDLSFVDPSAKKISLSDELSKNGGSMNMEDLMKLMG